MTASALRVIPDLSELGGPLPPVGSGSSRRQTGDRSRRAPKAGVSAPPGSRSLPRKRHRPVLVPPAQCLRKGMVETAVIMHFGTTDRRAQHRVSERAVAFDCWSVPDPRGALRHCKCIDYDTEDRGSPQSGHNHFADRPSQKPWGGSAKRSWTKAAHHLSRWLAITSAARDHRKIAGRSVTGAAGDNRSEIDLYLSGIVHQLRLGSRIYLRFPIADQGLECDGFRQLSPNIDAEIST
jgi:hypothetical protein